MIIASPGVLLAEIGSRHFLFSLERQLVFEAQPIVVDLWPALQKGISNELFITTTSTNSMHSERVLADLAEAGLVVSLAPDSSPVEITASFRLRFGVLSIGLHATGPRAAALIRTIWGHLEVPWDRCDEHLVVVEEHGRVGLAQPKEAVEWFDWSEIGPAIKIHLTHIVLNAVDDLVLHVATLAVGDEALLLCGEPGSGKSTLSVALEAKGVGHLEGDDLATLTKNGQVRAIPFPATLKSGAWPILDGLRPDVLDREVFERPDGQIVRYLPLATSAPHPRSVACVLCLDRRSEIAPRLEAMTVDAAINALLQGGWSQDRRLSLEAFGAVAACVDTARFFQLSYARLEDALVLVQKALRIATVARAEGR